MALGPSRVQFLDSLTISSSVTNWVNESRIGDSDKVLADRAYGNVKQSVGLHSSYEHIDDAQLEERIRELRRELGSPER